MHGRWGLLSTFAYMISVYFSLVVSLEFTWFSSLEHTHPSSPQGTSTRLGMSPQLSPSTSLGPEPAGCLTVAVWFKAGAEILAEPTAWTSPKNKPKMPWGTGSLRVFPFALQKKMMLAVLRALSWIPRENFVWVSSSPALIGAKLTFPRGCRPAPAGKNCEQSLMSPTQTRMNAQGVPAPVPIPAAMLLAISPAPAPVASPWLGTTGIVEVRSPGEVQLSPGPRCAVGSTGLRFQREAHTYGGVIFWKILRLRCWVVRTL